MLIKILYNFELLPSSDSDNVRKVKYDKSYIHIKIKSKIYIDKGKDERFPLA